METKRRRATNRSSLEFIESLQSINDVLSAQNAKLQDQIKTIKHENYRLRDELMAYRFKEVQIGRKHSMSMASVNLNPISKDIINGLHSHTQCIADWQTKYEPFKVNMSQLYHKDSHQKLDYQELMEEYKRFNMHKMTQSKFIRIQDKAIKELHSYLKQLKDEMKECGQNLEENELQKQTLFQKLKSTQLKKVTLMEQYQSIFNEFEDIIGTETVLKEKHQQSKQFYNALCVKSDELMLVSDQMLDCINEYNQSQCIIHNETSKIQRFFDQKWIMLAQNYLDWNRKSILLWIKYKMQWLNDNDKEQRCKGLEVQHTMIKYNISGTNVMDLPKYLGKNQDWKQTISNHIKSLQMDQTFLYQMTLEQ